MTPPLGPTSPPLGPHPPHRWDPTLTPPLCPTLQVAAIRKGLSMLIPLEALAFFTPLELEKLVIGEKDWSVAELKRTAEVRAARHERDPPSRQRERRVLSGAI